MKRFIVFQYDDYYPCGGLGDVRGFYNSLEDAGVSPYQNVEALDTQTGEVWYFGTVSSGWHKELCADTKVLQDVFKHQVGVSTGESK